MSTDQEIMQELLPPEAAAVQARFTPEQVRGQYRRAVGGTLEIIRFGAMLWELDAELAAADGGREARCSSRGDGASLKAWMEGNCPEINYKTAIRYKGVAAGLQSTFQIPQSLPLTLALPAPEGAQDADAQALPAGCRVSAERVRKIREQISEMLEGKSLRQLTFDFGLAEPPAKGGANNKPKNLSEEDKHLAQVAAAEAVFRQHLHALADHIRRGHHRLLGSASLESCIRNADVVLYSLRDASKGGAAVKTGKGKGREAGI